MAAEETGQLSKLLVEYMDVLSNLADGISRASVWSSPEEPEEPEEGEESGSSPRDITTAHLRSTHAIDKAEDQSVGLDLNLTTRQGDETRRGDVEERGLIDATRRAEGRTRREIQIAPSDCRPGAGSSPAPKDWSLGPARCHGAGPERQDGPVESTRHRGEVAPARQVLPAEHADRKDVLQEPSASPAVSPSRDEAEASRQTLRPTLGCQDRQPLQAEGCR